MHMQLFKSWAPGWLIRIAIFLLILPSMALFGLSTASISGAAGYYGIEPADVQYSMVVFYAAVASFAALERRFFNFTQTRYYLLLSSSLQIFTSYLCYTIHSLPLLLIVRFIQGLTNCATTSICLTLIFHRLGSERARELGYSLFYCILLGISPFTTLVTAPLLESFDFNSLYKAVVFLFIPGTALLYIILGNQRLIRRSPLYQLDWPSFVLYSIALCGAGFILVYGQQYYWFTDQRLQLTGIATVATALLFLLRQRSLRRPYIALDNFKAANFRIGLILIFLLYICRGSMGITSGYFASLMGMDPIHIGYMQIPNLVGIILSSTIAARLILLRTSLRVTCLIGFSLLLGFHLWMRFLFVTQANDSTYIFPMFLQGIAVGMLMSPLIIFTVSSGPAKGSASAPSIGVLFRFLGFCTSIALINFFQLKDQNNHLNRFQDALSDLNPIVSQRLSIYRSALISRGMPADRAAAAARGLVNRTALAQAQLRYAMDYYTLISILIIIVLLIIASYPYFNKTMINLRNRQPAPASY